MYNNNKIHPVCLLLLAPSSPSYYKNRINDSFILFFDLQQNLVFLVQFQREKNMLYSQTYKRKLHTKNHID